MGKTTSPRIKSASLTHQKRISSVDMDDGLRLGQETVVCPLLRFQPIQIKPVILVRHEANLAVIAALNQVKRNVGQDHTWATWHGALRMVIDGEAYHQ